MRENKLISKLVENKQKIERCGYSQVSIQVKVLSYQFSI